MKKTITIMALAISMSSINAQPFVADFETFTLSPNSVYSSTASLPFQTINAVFPYTWDAGFSYWAGGFAYTNKYDSATAGSTNIFGVKPLKGYNSSNTYVVAQNKGVIKLNAPYDTFDGFYITNTTYAYKAIKNGDAFSRKFGDTTGTKTGTTVPQGNVADYFKVTTKGYLNGAMKTDSVVFFLADYTFTNNASDYIVNTWQYVNTSTLGQVDSVKFFMYSTDKGQFGINTPLFFGIDNVTTSDNVVGITENTLTSRLAVYPNPSSGMLNIELGARLPDGQVLNEENAKIQILNLVGQVVFEEKMFSNHLMLNINNFEAGIYFVEITIGENKISKKLIRD